MAANLFLSRRLEQLLLGVLTKRYRALYFSSGIVIPTVADLEVGASEVVREKIAEIGAAAILAENANDIPVIDMEVGEDRYRVLMVASSVSYSMQQMRAMEKAGNANMIDARKMVIANRAIEEKDNKLAAFGSTPLGMTGFLNNGSVTINNSSFDFWAGATTAKQMAEFILDELAVVVNTSDGAEVPSDLLLSISLDRRLKSVQMSDNADRSVYEYLLANGISSITPVPECGAAKLEANGVLAGGTNKDRIVFYPREELGMVDPETEMPLPEVVERHIEPLQQAPMDFWETKNLRTVIPMFKCVTPTIVNYPSAMRYVNHAQAS
ncbi:MAG: major capsid family protein [Cyanobacteria bacterium J06638_20]